MNWKRIRKNPLMNAPRIIKQKKQHWEEYREFEQTYYNLIQSDGFQIFIV